MDVQRRVVWQLLSLGWIYWESLWRFVDQFYCFLSLFWNKLLFNELLFVHQNRKRGLVYSLLGWQFSSIDSWHTCNSVTLLQALIFSWLGAPKNDHSWCYCRHLLVIFDESHRRSCRRDQTFSALFVGVIQSKITKNPNITTNHAFIWAKTHIFGPQCSNTQYLLGCRFSFPQLKLFRINSPSIHGGHEYHQTLCWNPNPQNLGRFWIILDFELSTCFFQTLPKVQLFIIFF